MLSWKRTVSDLYQEYMYKMQDKYIYVALLYGF